MNAWGKELGIEKVKLLPDGDGKFTEGMDMLVYKPIKVLDIEVGGMQNVLLTAERSRRCGLKKEKTNWG